MRVRIRFTLPLLASLITTPLPAFAGTAPWYKWQGTSRVVCLQYVNPKWAFKLVDGPYRDATCKVRGQPS
ncbi:hypothetical protein [Pseudomonas sp. NA-150]|uniref:hypothetical protein n=1 Tax=Pseudomonas sp. NA-150 TaxID=3367525 RepID=UPI0037CC5F73